MSCHLLHLTCTTIWISPDSITLNEISQAPKNKYCVIPLTWNISHRTGKFIETLMLERLKAGGEGDDRGWDGWVTSLTQWIWVWASSRRWWRTGKLGVLQSMGLQRAGHDWATEHNHHHQLPSTVNSHWKLLYDAGTPLTIALPYYIIDKQQL